jgi:predicted permease
MELGGLEQTKERVRTERHGASLDAILGDMGYALRLFRKTPGFTLVVVFTLALGIGANTAIFSLIDALMLRWLPVHDPQQLVQMFLETPSERGFGESFSYAIVRTLADRRELFAGVAGFSGFGFEASGPDGVTRVPGALVTGDYYDTLGLQPQAGRLLAPDDDQPGAPLVTVISDGYWARRFARSASAIGEVVRLNGAPVTIVGVSPAGFVGANVGSSADITMPVATLPQISPSMAPLLGPGNFWLRLLARPRPGISMREAASRLNALWPQIVDGVIASHWPAPRRKAMAESRFRLAAGGTGWSYLRAQYRKPLLVLMMVVVIVLLIACANVASLLLARASARQREIAMRLAIGATRARIVRQLLIEGLLLAAAGALGGLLLALVLGPVLVRMISNGPSPITFDLAPNGHILVFTSVVAVATAMLFAVAPALLATVAGPAAVLKEDTRMSRSRSRLLPSLVTVQVALSLVLLAGAGLFTRTLQNLQNLDPGFAAAGVLLVDLEGQRTALSQELLDDLRRLPGVLSASLSTHTPLSGSTWSEPAVPAGQAVPDRDNSYFIGAGPGFFTTLQIPLLSGREFTDTDTSSRPTVAIVNESFAQHAFPERSPVGQHLAANVRNQRRDLEIVGVAKNTHAAGLREAPPPTVYVAYAQLTGDFSTTLSVRVGAPIGRMTIAIQQAVQAKLPGVLVDVHPLSAQVDATLSQERLLATLAGGFAVLALALASVGLYGLLAYSVAQRTKEIGIRLALGARRPRIIALVLGSGARLLACGMATGLPLAWAGSRWVESMLFGLTPRDPGTLAVAVIALTVAGHGAAYLPARRASCVDSLAALRHD